MCPVLLSTNSNSASSGALGRLMMNCPLDKGLQEMLQRKQILSMGTCICAKSLQSCRTLCNLMDCSPPGSSACGILQAKILEWVSMPYSRDLPDPGIEPVSLMSPALAGGFFTTSTTQESHI